MTAPLERGVFVLSLDFELIWGTLDLFGPQGFRRACEIERAQVVDRLLALLAEFEVPATWCVLGHLFLERCQPVAGVAHPEIPRPAHAWRPGDWFADDSGGDEATRPLFYGRSLVEKIRACPTPQEIGGHSFSHVIFGDAGCSRATAEAELKASLAAAAELGLTLRSFAFPRNSVGHLDLLQQNGFTCFRGPGPAWYERDDAPGPIGRLAHLWDVARAAPPPGVRPVPALPGLWNIPGSMIYFPTHGVRRLVPIERRVRRAEAGLAAAARDRSVFHLWFHPTNLADHPDPMFAGLRAIFARARALAERGELELVAMGALAAACESTARRVG